MDTIELVLRILLVAVSVALVVMVLLQQGRGASMGAAFGSGGANTMFGSVGAAGFLVKLTTCFAIVFFAIAFSLAWVANERVEIMTTEGVPQVSTEIGADEGADTDLPDGEPENADSSDETAEDDIPVVQE